MAIINLSLQVLPKISEEKTYEAVDGAIEIIRQSGVKYMVGPMETTMEGEPDVLWDIVKKAQDACIRAGATGVMSIIKMDYKPTGVSMDKKMLKYHR